MKSKEYYISLIKNRLDEKRCRHSLCVAESCLMLAKKYGEREDEAFLAGLLHDVMKCETPENQLQIILNTGIIISNFEENNFRLWHAIAGEAFLRTQAGVDNERILGAVRWHTSAKAGMNILEKIVYVADFISADRNYPDVETVRSLAASSLEEAMLYTLAYTIKTLAKERSVISLHALECYNELITGHAKGDFIK